MSDRIAVFSQGRLAQIAPPSDLYEKPANQFIAKFIGESSFLPLERAGQDLFYGSQAIKVASPPAAPAERLLLMLRPERLKFVRADAEANDELNVFKGEVSTVVFQGDSLLFDVRLQSGDQIYARMQNRAKDSRDFPKCGDRIALAIDRHDAHIVRAE